MTFIQRLDGAAASVDARSDILTLNAAKWRQHATDLDAPLHYVEITDPDENES
jgi:hypothetical protein